MGEIIQFPPKKSRGRGHKTKTKEDPISKTEILDVLDITKRIELAATQEEPNWNEIVTLTEELSSLEENPEFDGGDGGEEVPNHLGPCHTCVFWDYQSGTDDLTGECHYNPPSWEKTRYDDWCGKYIYDPYGEWVDENDVPTDFEKLEEELEYDLE